MASVIVLCDQGKPIPALDEAYPDIAVLSVALDGHPCVGLDGDWPSYGDRFQTYGFPDEGGSVVLTPAALSYRGKKAKDPTTFIDLASDTVKPGMSGGALLNVRSKAVCGIVVATRSPASPDGGLAVPWLTLKQRLGELERANREFHRTDRRWAQAVGAIRRRLRFRLPSVAGHFSGRSAELDALERAFGASERAVVTQAIAGLGGVGKTQLAAAYVQRHVDDYDVVAWIRAETGGIADLAALAAELGLGTADLNAGDRAAETLRWLERCEEHWLLVLDNVASPEQLPALSPTMGNGRVLITSRHRGMDQFGPVLAVDVFDDNTAEDYLVARAGRHGDRAAARRLAVALGGLPLALSHAGAYCSAGASFEQYLGLLTGLPAAEMFNISPDVFYEQTVASTWRVSIEAAASEAVLARALLGMAAYLAPDKIPVALFEALVEDATDPRQRKSLIDAINALHRFSLMKLGDASASVHRLVQKTVRDAAEARQDCRGHLAALGALSGAFPQDVRIPGWWPQCEQLLPHVLALGQTALPLVDVIPGAPSRHDREGSGLDKRGQAASAPRHLIALLNRACLYMVYAGGGERAIAAASTTADLAERLLGPEHPETLRAKGFLAHCYMRAERTGDAIMILERAVADSERLLGPEHPDTLRTKGNLANSYCLAERAGDAIMILERAVADCERLLGPEHLSTLRAQDNLVVSYLWAERAGDAIAISERVATGYERLLGPEHLSTLVARSHLAFSYQSAERTADAFAILEEVTAGYERLYGPEHPDTLKGRRNLAYSYWQGERTTDAIAAQERLVADYERFLGPEHPDTLSAQSTLAKWSGGQGRPLARARIRLVNAWF